MNRKEALSLLDMPFAQLVALADKVRRDNGRDKMDLCNILNAKSGLCSEDCKYCAQSCRHQTNIPVYPLKSKLEMLEAARQAKDIGAIRFGIVTSGNTLSAKDLEILIETISEIRDSVGIKVCASLGKLNEQELAALKKAGLERYHHNIETSPEYFSAITSTHSFADRVKTINAAKAAGLEICSGGIIGLGESWKDRIEMAFALKELDVTAVQINVLMPIKGTPMENSVPIPPMDAIRTIAIFRIILKDKIIKLAAGRETALKDFQAMAFMAGANGMLIGGYLTVKGRAVEEDQELVREIERAWKA